MVPARAMVYISQKPSTENGQFRVSVLSLAWAGGTRQSRTEWISRSTCITGIAEFVCVDESVSEGESERACPTHHGLPPPQHLHLVNRGRARQHVPLQYLGTAGIHPGPSATGSPKVGPVPHHPRPLYEVNDSRRIVGVGRGGAGRTSSWLSGALPPASLG